MTSFNYAQPFVVVGALIVRDGKVLLIKENHEPDRGKWNMPAGKLDMGESLLEGVSREVYEESGLAFTPTSLLGVHSVYRPHVVSGGSAQISVLRVCFIGDIEGEVSLEHGDAEDGVEEIVDYKWCMPQEIVDMDMAELRYHDTKDFIRDYMADVSYPLGLITHFVQS